MVRWGVGLERIADVPELIREALRRAPGPTDVEEVRFAVLDACCAIDEDYEEHLGKWNRVIEDPRGLVRLHVVESLLHAAGLWQPSNFLQLDDIDETLLDALLEQARATILEQLAELRDAGD